VSKKDKLVTFKLTNDEKEQFRKESRRRDGNLSKGGRAAFEAYIARPDNYKIITETMLALMLEHSAAGAILRSSGSSDGDSSRELALLMAHERAKAVISEDFEALYKKALAGYVNVAVAEEQLQEEAMEGLFSEIGDVLHETLKAKRADDS
jgi:hypothetical protein